MKKSYIIVIGVVVAIGILLGLIFLLQPGEPEETVPALPTAGQSGDPTNPAGTGGTDAPTDPVQGTDPDAPHSHVYEETVTPPTCTEKGYSTFTCECGDSYTGKETAALGHAWGDWVTVKEPTEEEKGQAERTCPTCGAKESKELDRVIHAHAYTEKVTPPTCDQKGYTTFTCPCGDTYIGKETAALGHSWGAWITTKAPTEQSEGAAKRICSVCGGEESKKLAPLSHTHNYSSKVTDPTCTERGYTTYTCPSCGDAYQDDYVAAKGHSYTETRVEPTCTKPGSVTYTCHCGDRYGWELPTIDHTYTQTVTAPTCTEQGYTTFTCSCGASYVGNYVPAKGHSYTHKVTQPTCTEQGYTTHTCTCGYKYVDSYVAAVGHSMGQWYTANSSTERRDCQRSGCDYYETQEIAPDSSELYNREEDYIYFGTWPQSQVTDGALLTTLNNSYATALPTDSNSNGWTSYGYYISDSNSTDYMWYRDVNYNGQMYRGVYFTNYRPFLMNINSSAANSTQDDNGFNTGTVYWFQWEPLRWRILKEENDEVFLLCDMVIDSQAFQENYRISSDGNYYAIDDNGNILTDKNGDPVVANNYVFSSIRDWLADTFYEEAFSPRQKGLIQYVDVDVLLEDIKDNVFLLSFDEVWNNEYGFVGLGQFADNLRKMKPTDYALSQGLRRGLTEEGNVMEHCDWCLRDPSSGSYTTGDGVKAVRDTGVASSTGYYVNATSGGICPALWISLEDTSFHAHSYTDTVTAPTCTKQGYTTRTCSCGYSYQTNYIHASGHSYANGICQTCSVECKASEGLRFTLRYDGQSYGVSGIGTCTDTYVVIPTEYQGLPVTFIGASAFRGCNNIKNVVIQEGITSIGSNAFSYCTRLTGITIPNSVTGIGSYAFSKCCKLTSITIPDSVTEIDYKAFEECNKLENVTIGDGVAEIYGGLFSGCSSLKSITFGKGLTYIRSDAFWGCSSLETITVDAENPELHSENNCIIDTRAKMLVFGWKTSVIPTDGSVTRIGTGAFKECYELTSITIPEGVTSIGEEAFSYCYGLTSITIPDGVTHIGEKAFYNCSSLTSITIPGSVTGIGQYAFQLCSSLTSIIYKGTMEQWNSIWKGTDWNGGTGAYTIYCTDGEIKK